MISDPGRPSAAENDDHRGESHEFSGEVFASLLNTLPEGEAGSVSRALRRQRLEDIEAARGGTPPRKTPKA